MDADDTGQIQHGVLLGRFVRARRDELRLTAEELAEQMGDESSANFIGQLETGRRKRMLGQPRLRQLARALRVPELTLLHAAGILTDTELTANWPQTEAEEILAEFDPETREGILTMLRNFRKTYRQTRMAIGQLAPVQNGASRTGQ